MFKRLLRREIFHRDFAQPCLGALQVERNHLSAAAFLRACLVPFVGEKMVHAGQQEGTEPAFLRRDGGDGVAFQQPREECLREVLGVFGRIAAPPHVGVERMPVGLAEIFERGAGAGGVAARRRQHHRPMGGDENRTMQRFATSRSRFRRALVRGGHGRERNAARAQNASLLNLESFCRANSKTVAGESAFRHSFGFS